MKKVSVLMLSLLALALLLAACSTGENQSTPGATVSVGEATQATGLETPTPLSGVEATLPPVTLEPTALATEAPTQAMTATLPAATEAPAALPNTGRQSPSLLSNLVSYPVVDTKGEKVGDVSDMVVNLGKQHIDYVIVDPDDALNISEGRLLLPWSAMKVSTGATAAITDTTTLTNTNSVTSSAVMVDNSPAFVLDVDRDVVAGSPVITDDLDLTAPDWDAGFLDYWRTQGGVSLSGLGAGNVVTSTAGITGTTGVTGTAEVVAVPLRGFMYAKDLLGKNLINTKDDDLGEVQDAVVNIANGNIQYLIVATGGFLGIGEKLVPVPMKSFNLDRNGNFVLSISEDQLKSAPNFDLNAFPDTTVSDWDNQLKAYWDALVK